jgi:very-short-patch-repair endonuclease
MVYLGKTVEKNMFIGAKSELFKRANEMRKNPTKEEKILWGKLRKLREDGFIFRRQHPIDIFIADFYCHKLKLIVEVDGGVHFNDQAKKHDEGRTAELEKFGITVIRFSNQQILSDKDLVIKQIKEYISKAASPAPPGAGDGRG